METQIRYKSMRRAFWDAKSLQVFTFTGLLGLAIAIHLMDPVGLSRNGGAWLVWLGVLSVMSAIAGNICVSLAIFGVGGWVDLTLKIMARVAYLPPSLPLRPHPRRRFTSAICSGIFRPPVSLPTLTTSAKFMLF